MSQSRILQSLGPASPFELIAVFHQKTKQTKCDADRHNHQQETVFLHEADKSALSRHVNNQVVLRKLLLRLTLRDKKKVFSQALGCLQSSSSVRLTRDFLVEQIIREARPKLRASARAGCHQRFHAILCPDLP